MNFQEDKDNLAINKAIINRLKQPNVKVNYETIHVNPTILFQRLIVLIERSEDIARYFEYELTLEPTALFNDGFMRKSKYHLARPSKRVLLQHVQN